MWVEHYYLNSREYRYISGELQYVKIKIVAHDDARATTYVRRTTVRTSVVRRTTTDVLLYGYCTNEQNDHTKNNNQKLIQAIKTDQPSKKSKNWVFLCFFVCVVPVQQYRYILCTVLCTLLCTHCCGL